MENQENKLGPDKKPDAEETRLTHGVADALIHRIVAGYVKSDGKLSSLMAEVFNSVGLVCAAILALSPSMSEDARLSAAIDAGAVLQENIIYFLSTLTPEKIKEMEDEATRRDREALDILFEQTNPNVNA